MENCKYLKLLKTALFFTNCFNKKTYTLKTFVYLKQNKVIKALKNYYQLYFKQNIKKSIRNYYDYKKNKNP